MIKLLNHVDTLVSAIPVKPKFLERHVYLENKQHLKLVGNIKNADKIMICLHGMGGSSNSAYIVSMINSLVEQFGDNICLMAPDMPGTGKSINTKNIWGIQKDVADINIDLMVDYILKENDNPNRKIFATGFSGAGGSLIHYLTDNGGKISNKHKDLISYSYLVSPAGPYFDCLGWIRDNSGFYGWFISACHGFAQTKFLVKNKNISRLKRIGLDRFLNISICNIWANGNSEYKFGFGSTVKNCDAILSKNDPIIDYDIVINFLKSVKGLNIKETRTGGHVGFYDIFSEVRFHEKHIIDSIKSQTR